MGKLMPLDILSSIKGATSSEAVEELFSIINAAAPGKQGDQQPDSERKGIASMESLRSDTVERSPKEKIKLIKQNFPKEKDGYLVVPKVIED